MNILIVDDKTEDLDLPDTLLKGNSYEVVSPINGGEAILVVELNKNILDLQKEITERKQAEEQLKALLEEKKVLLREVYHRVKNNMQIIYSLLGLQVGKLGDQRLNEIINDCQNRIRSMALIHDKLCRSEDLTNINFALYIKDLAQSLFIAYETRGKIALKLDLEDVLLSNDSAVPCGLILSELISNSLKHAFPGDMKGEVRINLCSDDSGKITLIVSNNGVDFPEDLDLQNTKTLGLQLVNTLIQQLNATIKLDSSGGTTFKITFKPK
ncbi:hypothetical protein H8E77_19655 [bacterium]|nr:hypothetical protein [bacterium]